MYQNNYQFSGPVLPLRPPPEQSAVGAPPPPSLPMSELFSRLVETGMIKDAPPVSQAQTQEQVVSSGPGLEPVETVPLNIPNLSFTPATLKQ